MAYDQFSFLFTEEVRKSVNMLANDRYEVASFMGA